MNIRTNVPITESVLEAHRKPWAGSPTLHFTSTEAMF